MVRTITISFLLAMTTVTSALAMENTAPSKRASIACEGCRNHHKACIDGNPKTSVANPCRGCLSSGVICVFREKKSGKPSRQPKRKRSSQDITRDSTSANVIAPNVIYAPWNAGEQTVSNQQIETFVDQTSSIAVNHSGDCNNETIARRQEIDNLLEIAKVISKEEQERLTPQLTRLMFLSMALEEKSKKLYIIELEKKVKTLCAQNVPISQELVSEMEEAMISMVATDELVEKVCSQM